jgi:hypothetical protein
MHFVAWTEDCWPSTRPSMPRIRCWAGNLSSTTLGPSKGPVGFSASNDAKSHPTGGRSSIRAATSCGTPRPVSPSVSVPGSTLARSMFITEVHAHA